MVQAAPNRAALQRNSSYTGSDGQPATHPQQPHFVPPQQPLYSEYHHHSPLNNCFAWTWTFFDVILGCRLHWVLVGCNVV